MSRRPGRYLYGGRVALLPALLLLACIALAPRPTAAGSNASLGFDASQALGIATYLSGTIGDRAAGSSAEQEAAAYLAQTLTGYGYQVTLQDFPIVRYGEPYTSTNVIAVKPGLPGYGTLYVGAHYDTVLRVGKGDATYGGPGANDNASGTSVLVETARVLAGEPISPTVRLIAFGAEELGLLGSAYYVEHLPPADILAAEGMLNMDCVGIGSKLSVNAVRDVDLSFAQEVGAGADEVGLWTGGFSDHASFAQAGIRAVFFYVGEHDKPCGPDYHRPGDTPDKLQPAALQRVGDQVVAAVRLITAQAQPKQLFWSYLPAVSRR